MSDKRVPVIESEEGHVAVIEFTNENGEIETRHIPWSPPKHSPNRPGRKAASAQHTIKRAWRSHRLDGESLRKFAKRMTQRPMSDPLGHVAADWLSNK